MTHTPSLTHTTLAPSTDNADNAAVAERPGAGSSAGVDAPGTRRSRSARLAALCGAFSTLAVLVGNGIYAGPGGGSRDPQVVYDALLADATTKEYVGGALEVLGFMALTVFIGWLALHIARRAPIAGAVIGISGAMLLAIKLGSAAPVVAARMDAAFIDPGTALVLIDINGACFVLFGLVYGLMASAAGIAGLQTHALPRWLAWWAAVAGVLSVALGAVGLAGPESYNPMAFLLLLVWSLVVGIRFARPAADAA